MRGILTAATIATFAAATAYAQTVSLSLTSPANGTSVAPGATIEWTITADVSTGDNAGLALVSVDLTQDPNNPELFDIPPANEGSIDSTMTNFSRPAGISNPGENGATTGYIGVQRGTSGEQGLVQIGGGQNTFGQPGSTIGTSANVIAGVGQGSTQTVVSGSFAAPATDGTYTFQLANALANVLDSVGTPPAFSPVSAATVDSAAGSFNFTVGGPTDIVGDANCDGNVDFFDIDPFVTALVGGQSAWEATFGCDYLTVNDINQDGTVDFFDIDPFVNLLVGG